MTNLAKIAFFDFCETLVNFQTADNFIYYIRKNSKRKRWMLVWNYIRIFLVYTKIIYYLTRIFPKSSIHKRLVLFQLKGYTNIEVDKYAQLYYNKCIRPNLIEPVIDEMKFLQKEGYRIVIVSGGYDVYLKYFAIEFGIALKDILSTKIKFNKKGICCGVFDGIDCLWNNKVLILSKFYKKNSIYSIAFSDSETDLPLLNWANKGIVVRRNDIKPWDSKGIFKEIVW